MSDQIQHIINHALPIIGILFLLVFCSILLIRIVLRIWLYFAIKNYKAIKEKVSKRKLHKKKDHYAKEDEELLREKEEFSAKKRRSSVAAANAKNYQVIKSKQQEPEFERPQIVDVVKPVGKWTAMVLGQKLTYLVSSAKLMNENDSKKGFWTSMVEAQARAAGRERGKGRY